MAWGCDQADKDEVDIFLIVSPAGLKLYKKFGFEEVGSVEVNGAKFTC
jgi:predicted acetyltransferase